MHVNSLEGAMASLHMLDDVTFDWGACWHIRPKQRVRTGAFREVLRKLSRRTRLNVR